MVILLQNFKAYFSKEDVIILAKLNSFYQELVPNVIRLRSLDFGELCEPRIGYTNQEAIQTSRVNMATAAMINYSLHPGKTISFIKGEYVGENRSVTQILEVLLPYVDVVDANHARQILTQGCPLQIDFVETSEMKVVIIKKANQATFKMYPKIATKTMNKEDRHSHLLPVLIVVTRPKEC